MFHAVLLIAPMILGAPGAGPVAEPAQFKSLIGKEKAETAEKPLLYAQIEGTWAGTVTEVGLAPYQMTMTFDAHGLGEVTYHGYNCTGVLAPVRQEDQAGALRFREIVATGRENCSDGDVVIALDGAALSWTWINDDGGVQATATLERQ